MIFLNRKNKIINLLRTIVELIESLPQNSNFKELAVEGQDGIDAVEQAIKDEVSSDAEAFKNLQIMYDIFVLLRKQQLEINAELLSKMKQLVEIIISELNELIPVKLNIAFMPYKVTMWDSLASIYEAAKKDKNCVAKVIPIPYYKLAADKAVPTYEGNLFPNDVPITSFENYDLEKEEPDIIFIHNAYDQYNTITRVDERFFTSNLKKHTDMLVFVPYHISSFLTKSGEKNKYLAFDIPTIDNLDKVIVAGKYVKDAAVANGLPADKFLVLGSPKFDAIYNAIHKEKEIPNAWKNTVKDKVVYGLDTNCMFLINNPFDGLAFIEKVMDIARLNEKCAVIWRPHPLTETSIEHYIPQMLPVYKKLIQNIKDSSKLYPNILLDQSTEYLHFLNIIDVFISEPNSLMCAYILTEKAAILLDKGAEFKNLLPDRDFYHFNNQQLPWYKLVKKISKDNDPKIDRRKNLAAKIYAHTDGTSGNAIFDSIKEIIKSKK